MKVQESNLEVIETEGSGPSQPKRKFPIARVILPVLVIAGLIYGYRHVSWSQTHEATDNAQVSGDVVQIVPQVSGTISSIRVEDNQTVKKGDLLVVLENSKYVAALQQAKANYDSAVADAQAAGIAVELTEATSAAAKVQSNGTVEQADAGLGQAQSAIESANANLRTNRTAEQTAKLEIVNAKSAVANAGDMAKQARAMLISAQTQLTSAQASVRAAEANVRSAQSKADLAAKDYERAQKLFEQGAISRQQLDNALVTSTGSIAAVDNAREALNASKSLVEQRRAEVAASESKLHTAQTAIDQARIGVSIATQNLESARAANQLTLSQIAAAKHAFAAAQGAKIHAFGQSQESATAPIQVKLKRAAAQQALAKVSQARAAVTTAQLDLERTKIYAPADGRVSKRIAEVGNLAQPGASLLSLVRSDSIFVTANFKETQVAKLHPGEEVSVEIDAFPGKEFHAVVDSSAAATGSTFALLPPDNATGNFVKVVQRLPVKIKFNEPASNLRNLQIGMSAMVTVKVG